MNDDLNLVGQANTSSYNNCRKRYICSVLSLSTNRIALSYLRKKYFFPKFNARL